MFYVYKHVRLDTLTTFYVGKGQGKRAYHKTNRNKYWTNIVNSVGYKVEIVESNLTELDAFSKEVELIRSYRAINQCEANLTNGGEGSSGLKQSSYQKEQASKVHKGNTYGYALRGSKKSYKTKRKMAAKRMKQVIDLSTGFVWESVGEASQIYDLKLTTLTSWLNGHRINPTNLRYL